MGDVALFTEQQTNTNTVMQLKPALATSAFPSEYSPALVVHALQGIGCALSGYCHNVPLFTLQFNGNQHITGGWCCGQVWLLKNSYYGISLG